MYKIIKIIRVLLCSFIFIFLSFLINLFIRKNILRMKALSGLNKDFARSILHILKVRVSLQGDLCSGKDCRGNFIISNHLSYIDGFILGSIFNVIYVSKKQVGSWPFFGIIAKLGGTVFIDRSRKDLVISYVHTIRELLKNKINVLLFPEGTSTNGRKPLVFQPLFFSSPIQAKTDILPVTIVYTHVNGRSISQNNENNVYWYGQTPFHKHLWNVLSLKSINAKLIANEKIKPHDYEDNIVSRHSLASAAHEVISARM